MEVTRSNFQTVLAELDTVLENATFLAIDGEFTGLNQGMAASPFETPAKYYQMLKSGSMDFLLVQFGLSVFSYDQSTDKYSQRSYNFYVFPQPLNRAAPDCRFLCQASSIAFLATRGFDFNKLFKHGVPYLTAAEEEKLIKRLEKEKAAEEPPGLIPVSDDDKPQIEEICDRIEEFLSSDAETMTIDKCNSFIRRLVYQEVRIRWPSKLKVQSKSDYTGSSLLVTKTGTEREEELREAERREKEMVEIREAVGLSLLLRKISESGKLIVGHNMLLDLCHVVHQFFGPLPETYSEFKCLVHSLFPRVLDTKIICQSQQFKENVSSSNLELLLETVSKPPFAVPTIESIEGRSYSTTTEKCHEAGYDAYITGLCFIALSNYLGSLQKPEISTVLPDSPLLNPFLNKLLIARLRDIPHINLVGNDPSVSRDHVFHMTFPEEWKRNDIYQLFKPYGGVFVFWLSDTTAFVELKKRERAGDVIKGLGKSSVYAIQKFTQLESAEETQIVVDRKRKLSASKNADSKTEESSPPKNTQDDDGWTLATGKKRKKQLNQTAAGTACGSQRKTPFAEVETWD